MESLLTSHLKKEGIHVYVANVRPFIKVKTDEGKEYYDLWFIVEGRGSNRDSVLQAKCKCKGGRDGVSVSVWTIFRNVSALMVVQTKFWNTNTPGNKEICTLKKFS